MTAQATPAPAAEREGAIDLPDGRTLSYAELGDPTGEPVVVLDGPGSRGLARAAAMDASALGVRLIAPDRPGYGGSTPKPDRTIAGWPEDLGRLVDELRLTSFGILAQSGGTPYALATAAASPLRVRAISFCGAISPLSEPDALEDVAGPMLLPFKLARRAPWLLGPVLKLGARQARRDPDGTAERMLEDLPPLDAQAIGDPRNRAIHVRTATEIMSQPGELARELRLLTRPWDVDLAEVRVPVALWVGKRDTTHPPVMSRRLAERLPDARVHEVADSSTFGLLTVYPDVLRHCARIGEEGA